MPVTEDRSVNAVARSGPSVIVLAAGKGTRMHSGLPKVLHEIGRRPLLHHVLATAEKLAPAEIIIVIGPGMEPVAQAAKAFAPGAKVVVQERQAGTGDAVRTALPALIAAAKDVLVLFGDTPLVRAETIEAMRKAGQNAAVTVLGFRPADPGAYGRLVTKPAGELLLLERIVEFADASPSEREIALCNSGIFLIERKHLSALLSELRSDNAKGEFYLTDIAGIARRKGLQTVAIEAGAEEVLGVNSRVDLAAAEAAFQRRARQAAMEEGATLIDPDSVFFSADTIIGRDVIVGPNVVFGRAVTIDDGATIEAFCHLEGAHIASGASVGPFARLRPGAKIGINAHIGNFVEIKKSSIEEGAKVNHLTYIGDARVGPKANIGAGTITCNYDGFAKHFTDIGARAFIGSNTALIAPVKIGDGAYIGSGSVIASDVEPDALAITRADFVEKPGWAARFRERHAARKNAKE